VLIRVGEFIYSIDFVVIKTETVPNLPGQVPMILGHPFLATTNALINCRNGMMRLSFDNTTLELNIFNMQRQPSSFDYMGFPTLNWIEDSILNDAFDDVFANEYESFLPCKDSLNTMSLSLMTYALLLIVCSLLCLNLLVNLFSLLLLN